AMLAAAAERPYTIPYGGACQMQFAHDVARAFIAAGDAGAEGAEVHNLPGARIAIADVVAAIGVDSIGFDDVVLPFPEETDAGSFRLLVPEFADTPLDEGVALTVTRFRELLAEGPVGAAAAFA